MAGYSGTPLPKKLGVRAGRPVTLVGAPENFVLDTSTVAWESAADFDVIVAFHTDGAALLAAFPGLRAKLRQDGGLWIVWPKKASKRTTDLTEDVIRDIALAAGLVDNKVCAVDEVWSGLRVVVRVRDRR